MKIELKEYIVNSESDFNEDDLDKIKVHLTVCVQDTDKIIPVITYDLYVINLNSQTGEEIDEQRFNEATEFVNNKFNIL